MERKKLVKLLEEPEQLLKLLQALKENDEAFYNEEVKQLIAIAEKRGIKIPE